MEAKAHTAARNNRNKAEAQSLKTRKATSHDILKIFKMASSQAVKIGTSRLQYEDMVRRAERKLSEKQRMAVATTQNTKEKAEAIAQELFHVPGSMLTAQEVAHIYQESECQFARETPNCYFPTVLEFRTIDGTCNNLQFPLFGASNTDFRRLIAGQYEDGISSLRGGLQNRFDFLAAGPFTPPNPSARFVSNEIVQDRVAEELPFTHILMQWGQFLDHDLDLSPELEEECMNCTFTEICEPIRVVDQDPAFGVGTQNNGDCLPFRRSLPSCPTDFPGSFSVREQLNALTSFIDGSMVYGSTEEVGKAVRAFEGGLLEVGEPFPGTADSLPVIDEETKEFIACPGREDCFLCGDARCNEQISLTIMHTIWLREHNRCARKLAKINSFWDDERLYQECRRIVGALIQKITYKDYLPKVFGVENYDIFVGPYLGYQNDVDPGVPNAFATAAYRYGHSLIRPAFDRLGVDNLPLGIGDLPLVQAFFNPPQFKQSLGTDPILRGLVNVNAFRMDEFLNSVLTTQLFQTPISAGLDLAALNIQRGRDHGLPPYLIWRNFCTRVFNMTSTFENVLTKVNFLNVYGSLDTIDLWVGGLAENRLKDSLLGATFACIFGLTFANVRNGDSFYYERPGVFTPDQLAAIRGDTLSRVLCDNGDDIRTIQPDAFLSNQTRVSCEDITPLDLEAFREEPCFFRIGMAPRPFPAVVETLTRQQGLVRFLAGAANFPPSSITQFQCQTIQCPSSLRTSQMIIYSNPGRFSSTSVASDPALPSSTFGGGAYVAVWDRPTFDAGQGGVFTSRQACESASGRAAVTFSFSGTSAEAQQEGDGKDDNIPDDLIPLIKGLVDKDDALAAAVERQVSSGKEAVAEEKVKSDDALIQELESALKQLH